MASRKRTEDLQNGKMKKTIIFFRNYWELITLALVVIIAAILRFSNITSLQFFTYDQARDALFVKRMIVNGEFRLLGTQTSLPGMYLPPFYYYTIAPVLWLFRLNPVGIDFYSALIGILSIPLIYFVANRIFGRPAGVFSASLFAISPLVVELSRRAWNPNTLPFFILIAFYFLYLYFKNRRQRDFLLAFLFYGYCLSLHFGAWTLMPLFIFSWFFFLIKTKKIWGIIGAPLIILFFVSPLLFFELRHNFFLSNQAKIFFFNGQHIGFGGLNFSESFLSSLIALFTILISGKIMVGYGAPLEFSGKLKELFSLSQSISVVAQKPFSLSFQWWGMALFLAMVIFSLYFIFVVSKKSKNSREKILPLVMIWVWLFWGILISRLYVGKFFFFYYLFLFPIPFLLLGFLFQYLWQKKILRPVLLGILLFIVFFHLRFTTVFAPAWRDLDDLKSVSQVISENIQEESFNLATIQRETDRWDRNAVDYRYFVESFGSKRALDWYPEDYQKAEILFVISETGQVDVLSSNIMEIIQFSPKKIIQSWELPKNIVIYKLGK